LFVEWGVGVLRAAGCGPVVVVLGAQAGDVRAAAELGDAVVVENAAWESGMGSSLRVGLAALEAADVAAAVILPVDVPGVGVAAVRRVAALAEPGALVRATYDGEPGHPVLMGREHWAAVRESATGDQGAREYLRRNRVVEVPCEDVASGLDVDRPEDLPD
jgi:nicotine blue oxidoreductase